MPTDAELEQLLSREASAFQREMEVERILKALKLKYAPMSCFIQLADNVPCIAVHTISSISM